MTNLTNTVGDLSLGELPQCEVLLRIHLMWFRVPIPTSRWRWDLSQRRKLGWPKRMVCQQPAKAGVLRNQKKSLGFLFLRRLLFQSRQHHRRPSLVPPSNLPSLSPSHCLRPSPKVLHQSSARCPWKIAHPTRKHHRPPSLLHPKCHPPHLPLHHRNM